MVEGGLSPNRIELESQILCASLRQSWAQDDVHGVIVVGKQLCELFPDLLSPLSADSRQPINLYDFFGVRCDASQEVVVSCYFQTINNFLQSQNAYEKADDYRLLLDAGYIYASPGSD